MFHGFANVWSPVVVASKLGKKPLAVTLAGERLVLFRGKDGRAAALLDHCPHRGVRLSLGHVTKDGCLACPFHGWEFGGDGKVCHVPLNPDAKLDRSGAIALPVEERAGLIFVHTAPVRDDVPALELPDSLDDAALQRTCLSVDWNCHWTRAMENMLDSPHVPFVHRRTIGRSSSRTMRRESRMDLELEERPYGAHTTMVLDGRDAGAWLDFRAPNMMVLNIPIPGKRFRMHAICVPLDENRTRMIILGTRDFATSALLNPLFNRTNRMIADEDRAIVESSFPLEAPQPGDEVSVRTDKVTLHFRKYYHRVLKGSSVDKPPRGRLGVVAA